MSLGIYLDSVNKKNLLVINAYDFPPKLGGVARAAENLALEFQKRNEFETIVVSPTPRPEFKDLTKSEFRQWHYHEFRWPELSVPDQARVLRELFQSGRVAHVIDTIWWPCGLATQLASIGLGQRRPRQSIVCHGVELSDAAPTLRKRIRSQLKLKKNVLSKADAIFPVSHFTASLAKSSCLPKTPKLTIIGNGVNIERFKPAALAPESPVLLTVSRLEDYKGIDTVIKALSLVCAEFPTLKYQIAGVGPDQARLEALARELGVYAKIEFLGAVSESELPNVYQRSSVFLLLTREDLVTPNFEGFGIVFLEAQASGLPVIGARSGGIPDAVYENQSGLLVPPDDPEAAAVAIRRLLRDQELSRNFGLAGRAWVSENYQWKHVVDRMLASWVR